MTLSHGKRQKVSDRRMIVKYVNFIVNTRTKKKREREIELQIPKVKIVKMNLLFRSI